MTSPDATPDDGRPSTESRARLAAELHDQLAASRMAWDAALLRSDAALAAGDQAAADAALEDHRALLGVMEERIGAVVAAAIVAREAEDVVRSAADTAPDDEIAPRPASTPASPRDRPDRPVAQPAPGRRTVASLLGAAAAVALLGGVLAGDLPFDTRGSIAGSSTEGADDLRTRVASERVSGVPSGSGTESDAAVPPTELPAFSGSLPPARTEPAAPASSTAPEEQHTAQPPATRPSDTSDTSGGADGPDVPTVDLPTDAPAAPEQPDTGRLGELVDRLDGREDTGGDEAPADVDGDVDGDVKTSTPRPLSELPERLRAPSTAPSASDPTGGLG